MQTNPILLIIVLLISHIGFGQEYIVNRLDDKVNSTLYDEISPIISHDGSTLYFTRVGSPEFNKTLVENERRYMLSGGQQDHKLKSIYSQIANRQIHDPVKSDFNQDIYVAAITDNKVSAISHPGYPLNSALPNSLCSLTPNKDRFVIINQYTLDGNMYNGFSYTEREHSGNYSFPEFMRIIDLYTMGEEVGLSMAPDGNAIILSLSRKDSYGGQDLYVAFKINDHFWSIPINLGPAVNSIYNETAPHISRNNNRLFFSSDRVKKRGFDIYYSSRLTYDWKKWTSPQKLPDPINSVSDDSYPNFNDESDDLYFTSNREGSSDIFRVNLEPIIAERKNVIIKGKIVHADTGLPTKALLLYGPANKEIYPFFFNSHTGEFVVKMSFKEDFRFTSEKLGHVSTEVILDPDMFKGGLKPNEYEMIIEVQSTAKKEFIEIGHLQFKQSKPVLEKESLPELNRLARVLRKNRLIDIRIEGHTDNVGDKTANMNLSRDRALAVKKYLVSKGIISKRISVKGYGESKPLNENITEEDKRINRRVEIRIIR